MPKSIDDEELGYFYNEIIEVTPNRRLAYRLMSEREPDKYHQPWDVVSSYQVFDLYSLGDRALVTYQTIAKLENTDISDEKLSEYNRARRAVGEEKWNNLYFPKLEKMLQENQ